MSTQGFSTGRAVDPVITGIGAITPLGLSAPETWRALLAGESGVARITLFDPSELPTQIAGEVKGFDPEALLGAKRARRSARFSQFAVAAAREAVADASLDIEAVGGERVGIVVNNAVPGAPEEQMAIEDYREYGPRGVSPYFVPSTIPNMPACEVAIDLGVHGPVTCSALACASGNAALLEARRLILGGEAEVVIAGGVDAAIASAFLSGLCNMGALSVRNDEPHHASRPFDAERDGFVVAEGAVLFVVESPAHAAARGARVYGSIAGGALTTDGFHISHPDPGARYQTGAIRLALERAGMQPAEVDYICAHGTATRINDSVETKAIRAVFGAAATSVPLSSPKSMTGHLLAGAGALSVMCSLLSMRDSVISPTINLETPDPECDLDCVPGVARPAEVRTAMVNAFGFGGQNCVLMLRAPES